MKKSVVLLSGGMDSSVNLLAAKAESEIVLALTFDYGQRAAPKEQQMAARLASSLRIPHKVLSLPFFKELGRSSLVDTQKTVPTGKSVSIDDMTVSLETAKSVWVPNRNGIFLNIAAGFAESLNADWVVPGFNKEEASTFPDNSDSFLKATTVALSFSTANHVKVKCFTTDLNKTEIVELGNRLKMDWSMIWPCYFNYDQWCGQCESCQRSNRALAANQVPTDSLFKG